MLPETVRYGVLFGTGNENVCGESGAALVPFQIMLISLFRGDLIYYVMIQVQKYTI